MQISFFDWKRFKSASNEDANQVLIEKDSDPYLMKMQISFFDWRRFRFASNEDANQFLIEKNSDLHIMKMQFFDWEKIW